jgi:hypothetical protein
VHALDLVSNAEAIFDSVKEIRDQTRSEGFENFETELLLKTYLERGLGKYKVDIFYMINLEKTHRKILQMILGKVPRMTIRMFQIFQHQIIIL